MDNNKILLARAPDERWASLAPEKVDFLPVLQVENLTPDIPPAKYQAVILTSANAARPDLLQPFLNLPVYAVGDVTAHMAQRAGCRKVASAKGTAQDLMTMLIDRLDPRDGALLYLRGEDITLDMVKEMREHIFAVNDPIVYATKTIHELPEDIASAFASQDYHVVSTYSKKGAAQLLTLLKGYDVSRCILTGLSSECTDPLSSMSWKTISPSPSPTFQGLYDHIKTL
jgi:uroporphyrinogen-III synthase